MPTVQTRDGQLHYEQTGDPTAIGPIVLLHGMGMASSSYADVVSGLAALGEVYAFDTVGHGQSECPADDGAFPVERIADGLLDAFDALGLRDINIIGNSLGAMTAIELAATAPDRFRRVVLVGCPGWDGRQRQERIAARQAGRAPMPDPAKPVTAADLAPMFTAPTDALAERVSASRRQSAAFIERAGGAVMSHDTLGRSFSVNAPTLLLNGERDIVIPDQPRFLRAIPDVRMVVLDDAGHYPQVDHPDRFVKEVASFLMS